MFSGRAKVRELAEGRRVLNLFAFTGGMGVAAAAGGAKSTTNVDNKLTFLKIAEKNYDLNSLPHDSRTFITEDAVRFMKAAVRDTWRTRYGLIVLDPPRKYTSTTCLAAAVTCKPYGPLTQLRCFALLYSGSCLKDLTIVCDCRRLMRYDTMCSSEVRSQPQAERVGV